MKYINREYGFEGRPPYFNGYYEKKNKGPGAESFCFPKIGRAGYGLDPLVPNSVLLAGKNGTLWGVKIAYQKLGRKTVDTEEFMDNPGNFYAERKDGRFSYFNHGDISASVMQYASSKAVLVISGMSKVRVRIDYYPIEPKYAEITSVTTGEVKGFSYGRAVIPGTVKLNDRDLEIRERYDVEFEENDEDNKKEYFYAKSYFPAAGTTLVNSKSAFAEYALDNKASRIVLYLSVSDNPAGELVPDLDEINNGTSVEELIYTAEKIMGSGELGANAANIVSRCNLNRIYDPYFRTPILVEDRKVCTPYFSYDPTELATGALVFALMGQYAEAVKQIEICATDYIMGAITSWIIYCRTRNSKVLEKTLQKFMAEREIDGELVAADKMTLREIAYKQNGSPLKDIKDGAAWSLDMSCYKLLYLDILWRMAVISKNKAADALNSAKISLKEKINSNLYNGNLGLYMDKYLNGEFVGVYTANSFLPLIAGAVDGVEKIERMLLYLKDEKEFGGEYSVPTLPRSHPLYGKLPLPSEGEKTVNRGYRGMIAPRMNFLIYLGLKRYGISSFETELSRISARLYNESLERYGKVPNFYISSKIQRKTAIVENSLSGNLLGFMGICEMLDVEYFRDDLRPALCFGTLAPGDHRLANIELLGHTFNISITEAETQLLMDGEEIFLGSGGKFIVRHFTENYKGTEFLIFAKQDTTLKLTLPVFTRGNENKSQIIFNVESGKTKVSISRKQKVEMTKMAD